jgi:hypothetical protein
MTLLHFRTPQTMGWRARSPHNGQLMVGRGPWVFSQPAVWLNGSPLSKGERPVNRLKLRQFQTELPGASGDGGQSRAQLASR